MFVAVGSRSNVDDPDDKPAEFRRANILQYTPEGKFVKVYAARHSQSRGDCHQSLKRSSSGAR